MNRIRNILGLIEHNLKYHCTNTLHSISTKDIEFLKEEFERLSAKGEEMNKVQITLDKFDTVIRHLENHDVPFYGITLDDVIFLKEEFNRLSAKGGKMDKQARNNLTVVRSYIKTFGSGKRYKEIALENLDELEERLSAKGNKMDMRSEIALKALEGIVKHRMTHDIACSALLSDIEYLRKKLSQEEPVAFCINCAKVGEEVKDLKKENKILWKVVEERKSG